MIRKNTARLHSPVTHPQNRNDEADFQPNETDAAYVLTKHLATLELEKAVAMSGLYRNRSDGAVYRDGPSEGGARIPDTDTCL